MDFVKQLAIRTIAEGYRLTEDQSLAVFYAYAASIESNKAANYRFVMRMQKRYSNLVNSMLTDGEKYHA